MNLALAFAGFLTILLGIVHSIAGELSTLSQIEGLRDETGRRVVPEWNRRVLRGTWHTLSLFGFGLGLVLFVLAFPKLAALISVTQAIAIATTVTGAYWAYITRLWHPAGFLFTLVAVLCWLS